MWSHNSQRLICGLQKIALSRIANFAFCLKRQVRLKHSLNTLNLKPASAVSFILALPLDLNKYADSGFAYTGAPYSEQWRSNI
jgi:hypothetical protein